MIISRTLLNSILAVGTLVAIPQSAVQAQTPSSGEKVAKSKTPSDQDVANAKSEGLVWVNPGTRLYYKAGKYYGRTKTGKFTTEDEAKKENYRRAPKVDESSSAPKKHGDQSGIDSSIQTHASTPAKP
jgi:hypothetical protein